MSNQEKYEIYLNYCGRECPQLEPCPHMYEDGTCSLDAPWEGCDDFIYANIGSIYEAEDDIAESEENE